MIACLQNANIEIFNKVIKAQFFYKIFIIRKKGNIFQQKSKFIDYLNGKKQKDFKWRQ